MTEKSLKYLSDIIIAISLIEEFTIEINDFTIYDKDLKTQSAVERQLTIIGEALNQFRKLEPSVEIQHEKQIIGFRNRLVHAYDSLDNSIVWVIPCKHIKPLKEEIKKITE